MRNIFLSLAAILIASLIAILPTQTAFANEESDKHNLKAVELHNAGKYADAIKEYDKAIKLDSNVPVYYANIGWAYYLSGDSVNAETNFKKVPDHPFACRGLANLYRDQGKNADAITNFIKAGKKYFGQKNYTDAITDLTDAINLGGGTAEVYDLRGWAYFLSGSNNLKAAFEDFDKVIRELDSNYADAYIGRANVYLEQGKNDAAITDLMEAGGKFLSANDYVNAEAAFRNIIKLNPQHGHAYFGLGQVELWQSNWQAAIDNYNEAERFGYVEDFVYNNRGWAKYNLKQYDAAIKDFDKAIETDATHADAYKGRGESYLSLTKPDYKKAKDAFEQYLKLNRKKS